MAEKKAAKSTYDASSIQVLEGLEPVRKRPGMYIGTTGPDGLHHLINEIFDNSRDEAMGGFADRVEVALLPGGYMRVVDNGRGIPTGIHPKTKVSALETTMTVLHAGGKFGGEGYKVSGGLHGVGASVVNALSVHTMVTVHQDGGKFFQEYEIGKPKASVKKIGTSKIHGTITMWKADDTIFKDGINYDWTKIMSHLRQQAYLVKGLKIHVLDLRGLEMSDKEVLKMTSDAVYLYDEDLIAPSMSFFFEGGLRSLVAFYNQTQKAVHKNIFYVEKDYISNDKGAEGVSVAVEVALQYVDDISSRLVPFANNIYNPEQGTHITGFKTALTRTLNTYAKKNNIVKDDESFTGDDVLEGICAVVSVKLQEIQFEGQTKAKLGSTEAQSAVSSVFGEAFSAFLEEHPEDAKSIINKAILAVRARKAAKAAKDSIMRKGALEGMTLPGKLADCQSRKAEESELFIVEGDSAGGTAVMGRDRKTQAVLPLRGKILNIERARLDKILASEQVRNLVIALGTAIGDIFDITKLRYHKIIIATDADVDGAHIRTLILTLLYRYFKPLIEGGFVYIAQPPLYKITYNKTLKYVYSDDEKASYMKELGFGEEEAEVINEDGEEGEQPAEEGEEEVEKNTTKKRPSIQRYKGLGEMNAEELGETTMDVTKRVLKQVHIPDAVEADRVIDVLMGTDVASRKSFIQTNARTARLDV
ncbi:MAG: DNA gyrase subunit B [Patescibacteria group bacterium]